MAETVTLSFRVSARKAEELEKLASAQDRPKSYLLERALDDYLEEERRYHATVAAAIAEADAGSPLIDHDRVMRWLDSWGTERELPRPKGKRRGR
jgi:predicted transcriptional regulator